MFILFLHIPLQNNQFIFLEFQSVQFLTSDRYFTGIAMNLTKNDLKVHFNTRQTNWNKIVFHFLCLGLCNIDIWNLEIYKRIGDEKIDTA
jgi:hypothetical protein